MEGTHVHTDRQAHRQTGTQTEPYRSSQPHVLTLVVQHDQHAGQHRVHAVRRMVLAMADDVLGDVLRYTREYVEAAVVSFPLDGPLPAERLEDLHTLAATQDKQYFQALQHKHLLLPHVA